MSYEKAKSILDAIRDGSAWYPISTINLALELTGDLEPL